MSVLRLLFNLFWVILGGLLMALDWLLAGVIVCITIIGIPWARAAFNLASFTLWPFGREAVERESVTGAHDIGTGALGLIGNVVWFVFAGIWLFIGHIVSALVCAITIIGIPFAIQHLKIAFVALAPIGKSVVKAG